MEQREPRGIGQAPRQGEPPSDAPFHGVPIHGSLDVSLLQRSITLAFGTNRLDKFPRNTTATVGDLLGFLSEFQRGPKDGAYILQGSLVDGQRVERRNENMRANCVLMLDDDTGAPLQETIETLRRLERLAVIWTTHSHLKSETEIRQDALLQWMRENGRNGTPTSADANDFLCETKRTRPEVLKDATLSSPEHLAGGVVYRLRHRPMPRKRVLLLLERAFVFAERGGGHKQAIEEWKERYLGSAQLIGVAADRSCVDPCRLMYVPRLAPGANGDIAIIAGKPLDLDDVDRVPLRAGTGRSAQSPDARNSATGSGAPIRLLTDRRKAPFRTKNLIEFLKLAGHDFEAAEWLRSQGIESRHDHDNGMDCECPNAPNHSVGDGSDRAFSVRNASGNDVGAGFAMWCLHAGCKDASGGDRGWYLDLWCQHLGIADAMALIRSEWTPSVWQDRHANEERANAEREAIQLAIAALRPGQLKEAGELASRIGVLLLDAMTEHLLLERIVAAIKPEGSAKKAADKIRSVLAKLVKEARRQAQEARESAQFAWQEPSDPDENEDAVWVGWNHRDQVRVACAILERENAKDPVLFLRKEGGYVRLEHTPSGVRFVDPKNDAWANEIGQRVTFKRRVSKLGDWHGLAPPAKVMAEMRGKTDFAFPLFNRIVRAPVFRPDGSLQTEAGLDPVTGNYLDPNFTPLAVSQTPTKDEIEIACGWLGQPLVDFLFSDVFDGSESLPPYREEKDGDGYPLPNPVRGQSSAANFLGMVLQHFVRDMILGKCPAYHLDKPAAGTGANYLMDVFHNIIDGTDAPVAALPPAGYERQQTIFAKLRGGPALIYFNNNNTHIDDGDLAALITAGVWRGRVLGQSTDVGLEVRGVIAFDGNNLTFSNELSQRMMPIRLDTGCENPRQDRTVFKYAHIQQWVRDHRTQLVWAAHTLVRNWIAKGKPVGTERLASFEHYSEVIGGILLASNIDGFLKNRTAYLQTRNADASSDAQFVTDWVVELGMSDDSSATARQLHELLKGLAWPYENINIDGKNPVKMLSDHIGKNIEGRTFRLVQKTAVAGSMPSSTISSTEGRTLKHPTGWARVQLGRRGHPKQWKVVAVPPPKL